MTETDGPQAGPVAGSEVVYAPSVYVIGVQSLDRAELGRFLRDHGVAGWSTDSPSDSQTLVEVGGRLCYWSFTGGRPHREHVANLRLSGHTSVFEHAVWTLMVTGVSRALTHELVRHRVGVSPSQLSQRYVDSAGRPVVAPPLLADEVRLAEAFRAWAAATGKGLAEFCSDHPGTESRDVLAGLDWLDAMAHADRAYVRLNDYAAAKCKRLGMVPRDARKAARGAARSILPENAETRIQITANATALRHMFNKRAAPEADAEIRVLAVAIYDAVVGVAPDLFAGYSRVPLADGTTALQPIGGGRG